MDDEHSGRFVLRFGIGDVAADFAVSVLDFDPFEVSWRFFQPRLGPVLGGGTGTSQSQAEESGYELFHILPLFYSTSGNGRDAHHDVEFCAQLTCARTLYRRKVHDDRGPSFGI